MREEILLVYDRECPACNMYCQIIKIKESVGDLQIVDAREDTSVLKQITKERLDIDQGMVLKMGNQLYYGADAIHALALIGSESDIFNRINHWFFKSKKRSLLFYPLLRTCRNLLLKLLRKSKINNLDLKDNHKF